MKRIFCHFSCCADLASLEGFIPGSCTGSSNHDRMMRHIPVYLHRDYKGTSTTVDDITPAVP